MTCATKLAGGSATGRVAQLGRRSSGPAGPRTLPTVAVRPHTSDLKLSAQARYPSVNSLVIHITIVACTPPPPIQFDQNVDQIKHSNGSLISLRRQ